MVKYELYVFGGSIGETRSHKGKTLFISGLGHGRLYRTYSSKKDAQEAGKRYVKSFGGGYRSYYKPKYRVIKVLKGK